MEWIRPAHPGYDSARAVFNAMIDRRPAVIAQCGTTGDVREALAYAKREALTVAVRSGGHSVAGMSMNDGGLVIDVRPMKTITVDDGARTLTAGGGVTWGELDRLAHQHGLAVTGGRASTTGVSGFTLGGGSGWLERAYGLACDNLVAVQLVLANGDEVTASGTEHSDLFWALHGGGGNFGVATSFTFAMHPIGELSVAGLMLWPAEDSRGVATFYRDFAHGCPELLGSAFISMVAPPEEFVPAPLRDRNVTGVALLYGGPVDEGLEVVEPLRGLGPAVDLVEPMPYPAFQSMLDDPPGMNHFWTGDYHSGFPDSAVDVFLEYGANLPDPHCQLLLAPWSGAVTRVDNSITPMARGATRWLSHPFAMWQDPEKTAECISWARAFRRDIREFTTGGTYLNFIGNEGQDRIKGAFGEENYARLAAIKYRYDPENVFRGNQNILPLPADPAAV